MKSSAFIPLTRHYLNTALIFIVLTFLALSSSYAEDFPGGIIEYPDSAQTREVLSQQQIQSFLPQRGAFTFPAPYSTQAVRLTNASDCAGNDCVKDVGYSYWRNINNHVGQESMLIVLGLDLNKGGAGPTLFEYNKKTDVLRNLGALFPTSSALAWASGEGWYFSATMPTSLYITSGSQIMRHDVITGASETVFDINSELGNGHYLWQTHSSDDDRVHSATVRSSSNYAMLGCIAYREDIKQAHYFPKQGEFDECQIDRSGRWLVIKENIDQKDGEDNRIIDLQTGTERVLMDRDGAGGHSDVGHGYMIASDNWANAANTVKLWRFGDANLTGTTIYKNSNWNAGAPAHISHTNANAYTPIEQQYACGSSANRSNSPHSNEIICVSMNDSLKTLVVAPVMTDMNAAGTLDDYNKSPKGNLDVTGQYFIWTSNMGGSRLDAFLVKVPSTALTGSVVTPAPAPEPVPAPVPGGTTGAPSMSVINAGSITASSVNLSWTTDEPAENLVMFGTDFPNQGTSPHVTQLSTSHSVTLTGLLPATSYYYNAYVRDADGNVGSMFGMFTTVAATVVPVEPVPPVVPVAQAVSWTGMINVANSNNVLSKVSGCDGCGDAGAVSTQQIVGGNGYLEFTATNETGLRFVGLTSRSSATTGSHIDFGIRLQGNLLEIRENGSYRSDLLFNSGDVLRVTVSDGKVSYSRNGATFYTSSKTPASTLRAGAALYFAGSTVQQSKITVGL